MEFLPLWRETAGVSHSAISEPENIDMQHDQPPRSVPGVIGILRKILSPGDPQSTKAIVYNWVILVVTMTLIYGTGYLVSQ